MLREATTRHGLRPALAASARLENWARLGCAGYGDRRMAQLDRSASEPAERRAAARVPAHLFINKYVDGVPHLCEALELSMSGMLVRRVTEPDSSLACYAVEIGGGGSEPAERLWLCASPVWQSGAFQALTFVGASHFDRLRLAGLIASLRGTIGAA